MADDLCFLTQSRYYNFSKNTNFQFISCIILHDLSLICSFVISYPLYSSYFIFFSPYFIKIISLISPPFIAAILISVLLTTTTAFCPKLPQLELEILQTVIHELRSSFDDLSGDGEMCNFEIYDFVFDVTQSITIGNEGVDQVEEERKNMSVKETVLEDSVHGGRRNDITTSEVEMDEFEEKNCLVKLRSRRPGENLSMKEKVLEDSVHDGRRNDLTISELDIDKFDEKNSLVKLTSRKSEKNLFLKETILEDSIHGGRRNDLTTSEVDMDKFENETSLVKLRSRRPEKNLSLKETILEDSIHGGRRNDLTASELDMDKFEDKTSLVKLRSRRPEKNVFLKEKVLEDSVHGGRKNDITISDLNSDKSQEENHLVKLFEELDRFDEFSTAIKTGTDSDKVIVELRKAEPSPTTKFRSEAESVAIDSNDNHKITQNSVTDAVKFDKSSSSRSNSSSILGSHGSMKEEKEWRRTLACKLFEERHNSLGGEEGMDSLWEAYEIDNSKNRKDAMITNKKNQMMMNNNGGIKGFDDDDDDERDMDNVQLCCLQALKLSTGKMNLGMKKPNLLKISKALKGFGWLHHVKIKQGKNS
ncbi:hypothetical protein L6452_42988 [Arctium lappa]|uniref:Uncharacterized protein n=1 Tax=Arctium lappa TaxID=4217 RepID=A0ACB8XJ57_ARCLA|nr:hypothetical protein L6452_42988 [Arctium lappa]